MLYLTVHDFDWWCYTMSVDKLEYFNSLISSNQRLYLSEEKRLCRLFSKLNQHMLNSNFNGFLLSRRKQVLLALVV